MKNRLTLIERVAICKARVEEQAEFATARTAGEKELGKEHRKVKEAQTKMELHQAKARHAAEKLSYNRRRRQSCGGNSAHCRNPCKPASWDCRHHAWKHSSYIHPRRAPSWTELCLDD
ncbi:hypothetical protein OIU84_004385 [Salix udensis]|uniref:Uncharacterized protein n=1 Tax=Salix udensis TaxID=889485 RepID=A0AAD6K3Z6_9ROSI|nr:hypothetical protein OIU84_004385 [Salix udensis]